MTSHVRIDFQEISNPNCITGCKQKDRKEFTENNICQFTQSVTDNLPLRCTGEWARRKIYLLNQYFGIFTIGMKDVWKGELNYIEICSGPGRCIDRSGIEFNGSALTIIQHPAFQYIKKALFFDIDNKVIEALNERIKERNSPNAFAFVGNYNQADSICNRLREELNPRSLNLVFIDPSDCSVPFSLIRCIKKILINSDFIINVASGTDFNRNVINALLSPESHNRVISKYNKFLGSDTFFTDEAAIKLAEYKKSQDLRNKFRQSYRNSLENLGYKYFDGKQVMNYYDIIFATVHERGLDFWEKATSYKYNGQGTLKL